MDVVKFSFEGSKLKVALDSDKDGVPVVTIEIDVAEMPSEIWEAIKAARA